mmetsp:Transcript_13977/g.35699  ORF Transcript_13977/g.35699 Transcript_13977/m.35699 type:complete len:250 (-) Transcript_13977:101-850(-)
MAPNHKVTACPSVASLALELGRLVVDASAQAIADHGLFFLALSGGSLPGTLATALLDPAVRASIKWSAWHVFFVDERYVPLDHPDSNYLQCQKLLFSQVPELPAENIHPINPALPIAECAMDYDKRFKEVVSTSKFDLCLLGMGPDGHTASLFPSHPLLTSPPALPQHVAHLLDSPKPPPERVTFTLPSINTATASIFVATGDGKKEILKQIFVDGDLLPAARVASGSVRWLVDAPAAALLPPTAVSSL